MKILLLNPPGDKIYLRDYYCSKASKTGYLYEPPDLLILSGILKKEHDVRAIDAIALGFDEETCLREIKTFAPQAVVFITGAVSFRKDLPFLKEVKTATNALLIGSGDIFLEGYEERLKSTDILDAILLDFTDSSILDYLRKESPCRNISSKNDAGNVVTGPVVRGKGNTFLLPEPDHSLFPLSRYHYPFVRHARFATVLTDYGCPFRCAFCVMPGIGFKMRDIDGVMAELRTLKRIGVREIYFDDQTFGAIRSRTLALLERMINEDLRLGWCCFTRVDVVDEPLLMRMKQAGCHTIMFGVETANKQLLTKCSKGIQTERVLETIRLCQKNGMSTVATFIIGLPGETLSTVEETIRFACSCGCDYASFNIAVPRMGTKLRQESIQTGLIDATVDEMDQSGCQALLTTEELSLKEIERLKEKAVRKFYGRPGYLLKQLFKVRGIYDLQRKSSGFLNILKHAFTGLNKLTNET